MQTDFLEGRMSAASTYCLAFNTLQQNRHYVHAVVDTSLILCCVPLFQI